MSWPKPTMRWVRSVRRSARWECSTRLASWSNTPSSLRSKLRNLRPWGSPRPRWRCRRKAPCRTIRRGRSSGGSSRDWPLARVKDERPDVPTWVDGMGGEGWTALAVATKWGATDEALDELGAGGLDARLDEIELAQRQTAARIAWLQRYEYPLPAGGGETGLLMRASNAHSTLAKVHGAAVAALGRSDIPAQWNAAEISRRLADRYALLAPALMAGMMLKEPPIRVIPRPEGLS